MLIYYRPEQAAANAASYSPSAAKPAQVVADWLAHDLVQQSDIHSFEPVTREQLAHDRSYVDAVLDLQEENGFGNLDDDVAASLPYTTGSILAAARAALQERGIVCSPTSGFHHAEFLQGGGFCTFNGLMVTALALRVEGLVDRVAILDLDMHYGNGTADIIERLGLDWIVHRTQGAQFRRRQDAGKHGRHYFDWLQRAIEQCHRADLVLYQAGADPHMDDPLGGVLTTEELIMRDIMVFTELEHKPLVWNLAGGYQRDASGGIEPVLQIHRNTLQAALARRHAPTRKTALAGEAQ